jgi:predicted O-methyltransferase YrrM
MKSNKNCIFLCVFNNKEYIKLLRLLLESIYIHNDLINNNIDIIIYTSTNFMNKLKQCHLMYPFIRFEINDTYNNIDTACKSRLDLFNLNSISNYEKILYLDTDILITGNLNTIFDLCQDEQLYVLEEGVIDNPRDFYGRTLFGDNIEHYKNKTAFTSGILLFKNCDKIKTFFNIVKEDIKTRPFQFECYDQPYIVYNAVMLNNYDNQTLKRYAVNNNDNIDTEYIIRHFPGIPGYHNKKLETMKQFMIELKEREINICIEKTKYYITNKLMPIIYQCGESIEGNIFMEHNTNRFSDIFILKVKNICNLLLNKNIKNVCEIGFNAGFSTLLMLICNPNITVKCFDLGIHSYTMPCFQMMTETFGEDRLNIVIGDSTKTLPIYTEKYYNNNEPNTNTERFDLIHIDGGHTTEIATSDIEHSLKMSRYGTILIMDDYDFPCLTEVWDNYIRNHNFCELNISYYDSPHHDIRYVGYNFDLFIYCVVDLIKQLNLVHKFGFDLTQYLNDERIRYLKNIWFLVKDKNVKNIMLIGENRIFALIFILLINPDINIVWHSLDLSYTNEERIKVVKEVMPKRNNENQIVYNTSDEIVYNINFDYIFIESSRYGEAEFIKIFKYCPTYSNAILLIENYKENEFIYESYCEFYEFNRIRLNEYQGIINKK